MNAALMRADAKTGSVALNLRVRADLRDRLDALAARVPLVSRHKLAVDALERGLALIEADPMILLREPMPRTKRRSRSK